MTRKTNKKCKVCRKPLEQIIIYDYSYYKCPVCEETYDIEEFYPDRYEEIDIG